MIDQATLILELAISLSLWLHVRALWRDKKVHGISVYPIFVGIFTQMWYFSLFVHFGLIFSALGIIPGLIANFVWLFLYRKYKE